MPNATKVMKSIIFFLTFVIISCRQDPATPEVKLAKSACEIAAEFPDVSTLRTAELAAWLDDPKRDSPILLDVREPEEYAVSHLPGARRVDPDADAAKLLASLAPQRPIILYCSIGYRSSKLAKELLIVGATDVRNLSGSIFQWANEGRPIESDGKPAHQVHPYNSRYAKMLLPKLRMKP